MEIAERVVEVMSSHGTQTFLEMANSLRRFGECANEGVVPIIGNYEQSEHHAPRNSTVVDSVFEHDSSDAESVVPPTLQTVELRENDGDHVEDTTKSRDESSDDVTHERIEIETTDTDILLAETDRILRQLDDVVSSDSDDMRPEGINRSVSDSNPLVSSTNPLVHDSYQLVSDIEHGNELVTTTNELVNNGNSKKKRERQNASEKDQTKKGVLNGKLIRRKRQTISISSGEDEASEVGNQVTPGSFRVSASVKSKGRPKIRRKQKREAKRIRMSEAIAEANALVQGTLVPVKDLALVRKTIVCSLNVTDALPVLASIEEVGSPSWSATSIVQLARKQKVQQKVTIVFPKNYLSKCIAGINTYRKSLPSEHDAGKMGVSIRKLGTFAEKDLLTMRDWHNETPKLEAVRDLCSWIRASKFSRIALSTPLNNCATVDLKACATRLEAIDVNKAISNRFSKGVMHELAYFRRSEWLDDGCLRVVMSHLMDQDLDNNGQSRIGGVNPLYARVHESMKKEVITSSPFNTSNRLVLIPIYIDGHWAGAVFDYENSKAIIFEPMQTSKYYKGVCEVLDEYFGEYATELEPIQQRAPRQEDTNSCGPLVLLFFECMIRRIPVPNIPSEHIAYFRFRYFFSVDEGGIL
ncbi:ATP-binding Cassette (ABC) Superfamily [Phytophthora nicotianae]|uniref:ATP-binding Cassette (ABC) Superfamily n=2 Tax=Phytophthora nicotianae TaxID=4792 RepID=A0A0W8C660_PHYNI|nr:ATP-binding Cassette (ABC) Superfamily [Phytophthora nicotianae]